MGIGGKEDVDFVESYSELKKLTSLYNVPVAWLQSSMNRAELKTARKLPVH